MNTTDGSLRNLALIMEELRLNEIAINNKNLSHAVRQELRKTGESKIGRNAPCPCGSGLKFKRCHYLKVTA